MPLKILAFVLPLSLDTLAVSAAGGAAGLGRRERLRLSLLLAAFEAGMPVIGFALGSAAGRWAGQSADWFAIALLATVGVVMLREGDGEGTRLAAGARLGPARSLVLGLSVSVDELAIGAAAGLLGLPVILVISLIAAQAFIVSQAGSALGARLGAAAGENAERAAGMLLLLLAAALLALHLTGAT